MRTFLIAATLAAAPAAVAAAAPPVAVTQAWSRPAAAGMTGAGFLTLINRGKAAQSVVGAESPLARRVEIHRSSMDGGIMRMRAETRVAVPAGGQVTFAPGGLHLMLVGLNRSLNIGDRVPVTLALAGGGKVKAELIVGTGPPAPASAHQHH
jgi:hypothetical protein